MTFDWPALYAAVTFDQVALTLTGVIAIFLSQDDRHSVRRWSCVFGMLGQPFWFYSSFKAQQVGIFILCFFYTFSWMRGFVTNWYRPWQAGRAQSVNR